MATRLIEKEWNVGGVLTNVTSAVLSDPTGTFGVKRTDTNAVVVADGTAMTNSETGVYQYSFDDTAGVAYTAYIEIVYAGTTYYFDVDLEARADTGAMLSSYSSLQERIGHFLFGIRSAFSADQTDDIDDAITDGLRDVYSAHNWSFFRPVKTITTADGTSAYDLPAGYESIESEMHYAPGESDYYPPVRERHDDEIRRRQQDDDEEGRPLYFSVRTKEFDPDVGSRRQLILYPTPDAAYVLYARMTLRPVPLTSSDPHPIGGEQLAQVILEACLAAAERLYDDTEGVHTKRFQELLPLAIQADLEASSPRTLGPDAPKGEDADWAHRTVYGEVPITFNGTTL